MATPIRSECNWKVVVLQRLRRRNQRECCCFRPLFETHNKQYTNLEVIKAHNIQLQIQVERLKQENLDLQVKVETGGGSGTKGEKTAALEQKLFKLQEELTDIHRKKGEIQVLGEIKDEQNFGGVEFAFNSTKKNAQQLIDVTAHLQEKEKELQTKDDRLQETEIRVNAYETEMTNMQKAVLEHQKGYDLLKDEHGTLQLLYVKTEENFKIVQDENAELIQRWMLEKSKDALKMNQDNELFQKKKQEKMKNDLAEAAREIKIDPKRKPSMSYDLHEGASPQSNICICAMVPERAIGNFDAHDGEVYAIKFSPSGRLFASGGADRKIKLWEFQNISGNCLSQGMCVGSNRAVMCVDFDSTEEFVLGSSNDFATRVWGLVDKRLKHTLTGHSGKVLAAKFLGESNKIVSGSHDRTLKLWDLKSKACSRTLFAMSSCNDLVTSDGSGTNIISGHFDKRIRFWDTRSEQRANEIQLPGRVTSLQLSEDRNYLLACTRDDSLKFIDLRMNQVIGTFCDDSFKVVLDYTRAALSPDGVYAAVGSHDGSICVWNVQTGKLETTVKEHNSTVVAVAWHPNGRQMLSCDRNRKVILWAGF